MLKTLAAGVLCLPLVSCAGAIIGLGAGLIVSQEVLDNQVYVTQLQADVGDVWAVAKRSLSDMSTSVLEIDADVRMARGTVDKGNVTVTVEAFDLNRSVLKVKAVKYGLANGELAKVVSDRIVRNLEK
jgi:hypothetical protein